MWAGDKDFINVDGYIFDLNTLIACTGDMKDQDVIQLHFVNGKDLRVARKTFNALKKLMQERGHKV